MSITKRAIFHISKVFPHSLRSYPKPSRLFFASASNYSDRRNAAEEGTMDRNIEMSGKAKETMREGMDSAKDQAQEMKERTKDYGHEAKEKAKEYAHDTKETAKEAAGALTDETKEGGYRAADTVTDKAGETVRNVGEMAKETVKGGWGMAKNTTQKIKETVVGKDDDHDDKGDRAKVKVMDEDAVELRQKAGKSLDEI
ncbi:hypothetical protein L6164_036695 [Bauhinia variegata]|uniref:Uncharacterized protein n=1 Tax=Bauhinia variegata TaxID=167791 RepID=A0ACB9KHR2_BAUVA|nr:hypothetical protein L6164_036695 [Bauhinia variegata]